MITGMSRSVTIGLQFPSAPQPSILRHQHIERDRLRPVFASERQRLVAIAGRR